MTHPDASMHPPRVLNLIGYWASSDESQEELQWWPDPRDLIGVWEPDDRRSVIKYLSSGVAFRKYLGFARCSICEAVLGSDEMTDGTWAWPQRLEHYVDAHEVQLPEEFTDSARAAEWKIPGLLLREFSSPEIWMEAGRGSVPVDPARTRAVILKTNVWVDWAAARIPARPAPDAITLEDAQALCARLSHRLWEAHLEERHGRWHVSCRSGKEGASVYFERCAAEILQHRLAALRRPDPDALLAPEQAQAVAKEFDGPWGTVRVPAIAQDRWLVWVSSPDREWPSDQEIKEATKGAQFGWTTFRPDGTQSFICPLLDELQWRLVLERIRADATRLQKTPRSQQSEGGRDGGKSKTSKPVLIRTRPRSLWERFRSFWTG